MKATITLDLKVKMNRVDNDCLGMVGGMPEGVTYKQLVKVFGKVKRGHNFHGDMQTQWKGQINGLDFIIHDCEDGIPATKNTDWLIDGDCLLVVNLLEAYFNAAK